MRDEKVSFNNLYLQNQARYYQAYYKPLIAMIEKRFRYIEVLINALFIDINKYDI